MNLDFLISGSVEPRSRFLDSTADTVTTGLCPGVPVHKGITIVCSLLRSHWLTVVYCSVFCIGSCVSVQEDIHIHLIEETLTHVKRNHERYDPMVFRVDSIGKLSNIPFIDNKDIFFL